ncbi:MAG: hypothetical protein B6D55_03405 [Candidatus Omnitrophica bacterium 4484_70.2]|nr:MAG: hypothetical protein B6D55_03405 [Candidatus Omnitrophica bacterium 4484_70.2]
MKTNSIEERRDSVDIKGCFFLGFYPMGGYSLIFLSIIIFLIFYLISKIQTISQLKVKINCLEKNLQELDRGAQEIIKKDMEVKLLQREVEDKLMRIATIKKLISSSLNVFNQDELFSRVDERVVYGLGFKKAAFLIYGEKNVKLNVNLTEKEKEILTNLLSERKEMLNKSLLICSQDKGGCELKESLGFDDFLIVPIKLGGEVFAVFFVGKSLSPLGITDAERIGASIVGMYLSQCLDKIKFFEDQYRIQRELEGKVKERTQEVIKSYEEVQRVSRLKTDFISSVSHELRTPLTSIKGFSSLLVEEKFGKLPLPAKERLKRIDENVNKLVDMVNVLLDISRIESGKVEVKITPSDLVRLIREITDFFMPQIEAKRLNLVLDLPKSLKVYMDKSLIERVFINLINNAIKFTPQEGQIKVKCQRKEDFALVSVTDTGCGISKKDIDKVFYEFYRADTPFVRQCKGSGLGLSLVKRIIDIHHEKIWIESEEEEGTVFYFTLRLARDV